LWDDQCRMRGYVQIAQDITEQKRVEEELRRAKDEAERANVAKSEFLASMSHELRTPLNAVIGFSDVMRTGIFGALNQKYCEYAKDIHRSGLHLLDLINDVLDMARIEAGQWELHEESVALGVWSSKHSVWLAGRRARSGIASRCSFRRRNWLCGLTGGVSGKC